MLIWGQSRPQYFIEFLFYSVLEPFHYSVLPVKLNFPTLIDASDSSNTMMLSLKYNAMVNSSSCFRILLAPKLRVVIITWYRSWIYNYLCKQCLLPLKLWVRGEVYSIHVIKLSVTCQASTLTFFRLSCTSENWRQTSRFCIMVVRRDKWKIDCPNFWRLFSMIKMCCFVILTDKNFVNNYFNVF